MKNLNLLFVAALAALSMSCSHDDDESIWVSPDVKYTGLSINNSIGFDADVVTYKLRQGKAQPTEYGLMLSYRTVQKLSPGGYIIYDLKVYRNNELINYESYTTSSDGTEHPVSSSSLVEIKQDEVFNIYLRND